MSRWHFSHAVKTPKFTGARGSEDHQRGEHRTPFPRDVPHTHPPHSCLSTSDRISKFSLWFTFWFPGMLIFYSNPEVMSIKKVLI